MQAWFPTGELIRGRGSCPPTSLPTGFPSGGWATFPTLGMVPHPAHHDTADFRFCSFSVSLRRNVRLFIWDFSYLLRWACNAVSLPVISAFAASPKFWYVVLSFSFVSMYHLISDFIFSLTPLLFSSMLFNLHVFSFSSLFQLINSFKALWSVDTLSMISVLLNLLRLVLYTNIGTNYPWIVHMHWRRMCYLVFDMEAL